MIVKQVLVQTRIDPIVKESLTKRAQAHDTSLARYVAGVLRRHVEGPVYNVWVVGPDVTCPQTFQLVNPPPFSLQLSPVQGSRVGSRKEEAFYVGDVNGTPLHADDMASPWDSSVGPGGDRILFDCGVTFWGITDTRTCGPDRRLVIVLKDLGPSV